MCGRSVAGTPIVPRPILAIARADREATMANLVVCCRIAHGRRAAALIALLAFACSLLVVVPPAEAQKVTLGGPQGVVRSAKGDLLEGIMVQLIATKNAIRTTVYSNADGRYEFPKLEPGTYTLRIAQPREFHAFVKEGVAIAGATPLDDITLSRVAGGELLPPTP